MTAGIRPIIESAVTAALADHPKYFTDRGHERAREMIVRKVMAAIRGDGARPEDSPSVGPSEPVKPRAIDPKSRDGLAYNMMRAAAGATSAFKMGDGTISLPPESQNDAVMAFADAPPKAEWPFISDRQQVGAWTEFFRTALPAGTARQSIIEHVGDEVGIRMPWPWPPSKTGRIYQPEPEAESEPAE